MIFFQSIFHYFQSKILSFHQICVVRLLPLQAIFFLEPITLNLISMILYITLG